MQSQPIIRDIRSTQFSFQNFQQPSKFNFSSQQIANNNTFPTLPQNPSEIDQEQGLLDNSKIRSTYFNRQTQQDFYTQKPFSLVQPQNAGFTLNSQNENIIEQKKGYEPSLFAQKQNFTNIDIRSCNDQQEEVVVQNQVQQQSSFSNQLPQKNQESQQFQKRESQADPFNELEENQTAQQDTKQLNKFLSYLQQKSQSLNETMNVVKQNENSQLSVISLVETVSMKDFNELNEKIQKIKDEIQFKNQQIQQLQLKLGAYKNLPKIEEIKNFEKQIELLKMCNDVVEIKVCEQDLSTNSRFYEKIWAKDRVYIHIQNGNRFIKFFIQKCTSELSKFELKEISENVQLEKNLSSILEYPTHEFPILFANLHRSLYVQS